MVGAHARAMNFTDVTLSSGIDHVQFTDGVDLPYRNYMTGGAAAADYDSDGWVDLFVTRLDDSDLLYRNRGDGTFEDVSTSAGFTQNLATNGATWGDLDNDGDADLYVTAIFADRNYLYINNGAGGFTEQAVPRDAGVETASVVSRFGAAMGDYDHDGFLDIYTTQWGASPFDPAGLAPNASRLLRNQGATSPAHFVDTTDAAGLGFTQPSEPVYGFAPRFSDLNGDGVADLVIASDFGTSRLLWGDGDGTFTEGTAAAGVGTDENGMGSTIGDYDGDGRLDWFVTSIHDDEGACTLDCNWGGTGNRLYRNNGDRTFSDTTDTAGVREGGWGWGTSFADFDNDADLDLAMTNGIRFPRLDLDAKFNDDPMRLWQNDGAADPTFTEVSADAGVDDTGSGKGLLTFDYDRDGDLDLFVVNNAGAPVLYRNDSDNDAAWLQIDTVGTLSNRDGIGAFVTITVDESEPGVIQVREIDGGSNYLAQNERLAHFGLGADIETIDLITIEWPSGVVQTLYDITANQRLVLVEPVPEPTGLTILIAAAIVASRRHSLA